MTLPEQGAMSWPLPGSLSQGGMDSTHGVAGLKQSRWAGQEGGLPHSFPQDGMGVAACQQGQGLLPSRSSGAPGSDRGVALPPAPALPRALQMGLSAAK